MFIEGALQQSTSRAPTRPSGISLPSGHDPALKQSLDCVNMVRDSSGFGIDVYMMKLYVKLDYTLLLVAGVAHMINLYYAHMYTHQRIDSLF